MDISGCVLIDLHLNLSWGHLFHLCSCILFIEEVILGMLFVHNNHLFDGGICPIIISTPCVWLKVVFMLLPFNGQGHCR